MPWVTLGDMCHLVTEDQIEINGIIRQPGGVEANSLAERHARRAARNMLLENDVELPRELGPIIRQERENLRINFVAELAGALGQVIHLRRLIEIHAANEGCVSRGAFGGGGRANDRASAKADRNTDRDKENDLSARSSPHGTGYSSR